MGTLQALIAGAIASKSHGLILIHRGKVVVERYFGDRHEPIELMSITKSIVSLALGCLVRNGHVSSVDLPLSTWFPEWAEGRRAEITLRHLLTHTSGLTFGSAGRWEEEDRLGLAQLGVVTGRPGSQYVYSNDATELIGGIIQASTGKSVEACVVEHVLQPIGIRVWEWRRDRTGRVAVAGGLALNAEDLARVGLLMLQQGRWGNAQVIPREWIVRSTSPGIAATPFYGYLWYLRRTESLSRNESASGDVESWEQGFYADGWLGQKLWVIPKEETIAVRLHRAVAGGQAEENQKYGFPSFPSLLAAVLDSRAE